MNKFVKAPDYVTFSECLENDFKLSSSLYTKLIMKNTNAKPVSDFLLRKLSNSDLGTEIGSLSYIDKSTHYFLRTKGLQKHSFIPVITKESALPMLPTDFVNMNLKKGDLIISKDSNIGEIAILEKDYPNYMLSSAIYKLPVKEEWKYYLFAMIKHDIFREQLDAIVPKGVTIRHAKTLFLKCLIPLPNKNTNEVIRYISVITKQIVEKESLIQKRHEAILRLIETELLENQNDDKFRYNLPCINEVEQIGRLDTGMYSEKMKSIVHLIKNYTNGFFQIDEQLIKSGSTPKIRYVGFEKRLSNQWITPSYCSDYGTIDEYRINMQCENNINENSILIINRTSKGGLGEYVGITSYFDFEKFGKGHHNQGMYRVSYLNKTKSLFILCCMNSEIYRELCSCVCVGSKMKEIKTYHIANLPFPKFPESKQKEIVKLYSNENVIYNLPEVSLENFETIDSKFNEQAGIYELDNSAKHLKVLLDNAIYNIVNDMDVPMIF